MSESMILGFMNDAVTPYSGKGTTFLLEKPTVISYRD
jgi:hypothetical protein